MTVLKYLLPLSSVVLFSSHGFAAKDRCGRMERRIGRIIDRVDATVGVAVVADGCRLALNDTVRYPLMSVFKFHVAFAALRKMEREGVDPDSVVRIEAGRMHRNTYSPLRDKYPGRDIDISYADLLRYAVSESDNNACDLLIDYIGGIAEVSGEVAGIVGGEGFALSQTEDSMHADPARCYDNWSYPSALTGFMAEVYGGGHLGEPYMELLADAMVRTATGADKMRAGLPAGVVFGHKTGSSDRTADGIKIGDNDAGVIRLPSGGNCFIAVLIKDSAETDAVNARTIASVTEAVFEALAR